MYVKLFILTPKNKIIIHLESHFSDFEIQLARKIRTDVLSLYRKMSSLGAPDILKRVQAKRSIDKRLTDKRSTDKWSVDKRLMDERSRNAGGEKVDISKTNEIF